MTDEEVQAALRNCTTGSNNTAIGQDIWDQELAKHQHPGWHEIDEAEFTRRVSGAVSRGSTGGGDDKSSYAVHLFDEGNGTISLKREDLILRVAPGRSYEKRRYLAVDAP